MDHDADDLNEIVIPLMNIARRLPSGTVNEKEPNFQQICINRRKTKDVVPLYRNV